MYYSFNPFGKEFKDINEDDLELLKTISEGWYIEYKREKPDAKKIAKSISSFANSHGGVYFIGIESDKVSNKATNIIGVDDNPEVIRDSIRGNLQPFPYFETFCIQLKNKKHILMTIIKEGEYSPYIHNDGRIYRRQESASDPIFEDNRFVIDELYNRSKTHQKKIKIFRKTDISMTKGEHEIPLLQIFINTNPFNHFNFPDFFTDSMQSEIINHFNIKHEIFRKDQKAEYLVMKTHIPFDTISTYYNSFSLRQLHSNPLLYNGLTVELDMCGNFKALIPFPYNFINESKFDKSFLTFINSTPFQSIDVIKFINLENLFLYLIGLIYIYITFLKKYGFKNNLEFYFKLDNCWRTSLYSKALSYLEYIGKYGLPICMKNKQIFPKSGIFVDFNELIKNPLGILLKLFTICGSALGIPDDVLINVMSEKNDF